MEGMTFKLLRRVDTITDGIQERESIVKVIKTYPVSDTGLMVVFINLENGIVGYYRLDSVGVRFIDPTVKPINQEG